MKRILIFAILLAMLLAGCARDLPGYELPSESKEPNESTEATPAQSKEWEEFNTYPVDLDVDALLGHTDHEIVFLQGKHAQYYDVEMHRAFALCSQPNCSHSDESCPSYFGGDSLTDTDYSVSGDSIYAVCTADDGHTLRLRQLKPLTGEKTDLYTDTLPEPVRDTAEDGTPRYVMYSFESPDLLFTGSALILQYQITRQEDRFEADRQTSHHSGEKVILRYDLSGGTMRELLRSDVPISSPIVLSPDEILDASDQYALLRAHDSFTETPFTEAEYVKNGGATEDYEDYIEGILDTCEHGEILLWDLETGEKTVLCAPGELRIDSSYAFDRQHHRICFLKNDRELWRLDLRNGSQTKLLELDGNVCNISQWDGRVFFSTWRHLEDGTTWYDWYWYEPTTGQLRQLQKEISMCRFSIIGETDSYLIGYTENGGTAVLAKQDYYNENYEAAQSLGFAALVN